MWPQFVRDMSSRAYDHISSIIGEETAFSVQLLVALNYIYNPFHLQMFQSWYTNF
jgi:hypothetical protein